MKTTVQGILAKVVGAGLLAGAVAIAVPAAQAQQFGFGVQTYSRPVDGYYNNGYYATPYDRYDRFREHEAWERRRAWERHEAEERRHFEHEQHERMEHGGYYGYGWR